VNGLEKRLANLRPYKPGQNRHTTKRERIDVKFAELIAEFFPNGGYSVMDAARLKLAAQHYVDAETCRDPVIRQRATRTAEYLLNKIRPVPARLPAMDDPAALALALLQQKPSDGV
jgi:hypothetical protein